MARHSGATVAALATLILHLCGFAAAAPESKKTDPKLQSRIEAALQKQPEMVAAAIGKLAPQQPGIRDVYFIGVAGWGDQDVFRKEVRAVRSLFEKSFDAKDRAVSLVNHRATLDMVPLATRDTIEATVMAVAGIMDPEEDLLVMFLTSHGVEWEGFELVINGTDLGRLRGPHLARILGASRIRNRVVIVSSCYSGQFVPALAEESTLLITAAASDRTSFGCSNNAKWTWFGQAYFRDALPKHGRFIPAFTAAKKDVERREKKQGYKASLPQIRVGDSIRSVLDEMGL